MKKKERKDFFRSETDPETSSKKVYNLYKLFEFATKTEYAKWPDYPSPLPSMQRCCLVISGEGNSSLPKDSVPRSNFFVVFVGLSKGLYSQVHFQGGSPSQGKGGGFADFKAR